MSNTSANHKSLVRLPLSVFRNLVCFPDDSKEEASVTDLKETVCSKLAPRATSVLDLLQLSPITLMHLVSPAFTFEECKELIRRICALYQAPHISAMQLLRRQQQKNSRSLSSGLPSLDTDIVRFSSITEIVGQSGVGKSQLAMQLCVLAAADKGFGTIYIDTETNLRFLPRLHQIAQSRSPSNAQEVIENVILYNPSSTQELMTILNTRLEEDIIRQNSSMFPIRLIIIDSIAAPLLCERNAPQRSKIIFEMSQLLKRIADEWNLAVVVTNQIVSTNNVTVNSALGTSWYHCVTTRLLLQQQQVSVPMEGEASSHFSRIAKIQKSNIAGLKSVHFQITQIGICEIV